MLAELQYTKTENSRKIVVYKANNSNISRHILHTNYCDNKPPKGLQYFRQTHLLKHFCLVAFTTNVEFYLMSMVTGPGTISYVPAGSPVVLVWNSR